MNIQNIDKEDERFEPGQRVHVQSNGPVEGAFEVTVSAAPEVTEGQEEQKVYAGNGPFNRSAIKRHALKISKQVRQGKFCRVSEQFLDDCIASFEAKIATLPGSEVNSPLGQVTADEFFLTGEGERKLIEKFNLWMAREIHRKTNNVRTGKTF